MTDRSADLDSWVRATRRKARIGRRDANGCGPPRRARNAEGLPKNVYRTHLGRIVAKVQRAGKMKYLGTFGTVEEARLAVEKYREKTR